MYNFKFKRINDIELALFDYGAGKLFKVIGNCWNFKQDKIEIATKELLQFIHEEGCNYKVEAVYDTANQILIIRSKKMKQIVKVESYLPIKHLIEKYNLQTDEDKDLLYNRTDLEVVRGHWDGDMLCKQTSYQYYDFDKGEWVVLPNPTQPKIEGISVNDNKEEGAE